MSFIKVTADKCNESGLPVHTGVSNLEFYLNNDLVGGILGKTVLLKGSNVLYIGGHHYTNIQLSEDVDIESIQ